MNYKGAWSGGTDYVARDVVVFTDNVAYVAVKDPPTGTIPHDTHFWNRVGQPIQEVIMMFYGTLSEIASEKAEIDAVKAEIAPAYSKTTYSKGDIVSHSGKLYEAKADIGTAEDWTAAHWQEITIGATLTALNAAVATIPDNISDEAITLSTDTADYLITVDDSGETPELDVTAIEEEAGT